MVFGILVVIWIAVLTPLAIRHFRDHDTNRSIVSFKEQMAHLGTESPIVAPAHRLDEADETPPRAVRAEETQPPAVGPRLRVVPANATVADLEREMSWAEWSSAQAFEPEAPRSPRGHPVVTEGTRVAAYSRVPNDGLVAALAGPPLLARSQRERRRNVLVVLAASVVCSTLTFVLANVVIVDAWAVVSWVALASYLGLMYYAITTGMMGTPSLRITRPLYRDDEGRDDDTQQLAFDFDGEPIPARLYEYTEDERYRRAL